jgi:hypothetical protein
MKQSFVLAAACALALTACGGGEATYPVNVTVSGVIYPGLVLTTNGQDLAVDPASSGKTIAFPNALKYGDVYAITIKAQPAHETCSPYSGTNDSAGHLAQISAYFTCGLNAYSLGGKIVGMTGTGLVLTNGSTGGTFTPVAGATEFTLPSVAYGSTYGVTVLTQPAGQTCSVQNGVGTLLKDEAITNLIVTCVTP